MSEIKDVWLHAHKMIRSARQAVAENLRPLNLSGAEGTILLHLFTQGEEMRQEQLVEQLDISKPAVSRTLASLERKGYVTRQRDHCDKRAHQVRLTEKARDVGPAIKDVYDQVYTAAVSDLSPEELDHLVALFARLSRSFLWTQENRQQR